MVILFGKEVVLCGSRGRSLSLSVGALDGCVLGGVTSFAIIRVEFHDLTNRGGDSIYGFMTMTLFDFGKNLFKSGLGQDTHGLLNFWGGVKFHDITNILHEVVHVCGTRVEQDRFSNLREAFAGKNTQCGL